MRSIDQFSAMQTHPELGLDPRYNSAKLAVQWHPVAKPLFFREGASMPKTSYRSTPLRIPLARPLILHRTVPPESHPSSLLPPHP